MTVVTAMGQMFYSLSIAMGILVTFGSYMKKDTSIEDSTRNVEVFDTAIAIMAGLHDYSGCVCILRWRSGYAAGRSVINVYYNSKGI